MRLGAPVVVERGDPEAWIAALREHGYSTAAWPLDTAEPDDVVQAYCRQANRADVTIAEVGAWCNPLSRDQTTREAAIRRCQERLALADTIGARCCVNIAGSRAEQWDGPDVDNFSDDTFAMIVDVVREIIDAVRPSRTFYALEPMPWIYPDSADSYLALIRAIDRPRFAVHLDPVNVITSPRTYFANGELIREWFTKLGPAIKSCHAKDILLGRRLTVHLDEVRPGLGALDYRTYLRELSRLDPDTPLLLEHLPEHKEYRLAAEHLRSVAAEIGASFR
jgi:sugar phosphate isomerase/epimerase